MSDAARPRSASLAGILVVLLFVAFALAGPVIIVRDRLRADAGGGPRPPRSAPAAAATSWPWRA